MFYNLWKKNRTLSLILFFFTSCFPFVSHAEGDLNMNIQANILETTCKLTLRNGGSVHLPTVSVAYFSDRGSPPAPILPTDQLGGYPFTVSLSECTNEVDNIHFSFAPQSGNFAPTSKQVFISETNEMPGGANNVGVVIFSKKYNTNVLEPDGTSDVNFPVDASTFSSGMTDFNFYVRYQNTGMVTAGKVTSKVLVSVNYE